MRDELPPPLAPPPIRPAHSTVTVRKRPRPVAPAFAPPPAESILQDRKQRLLLLRAFDMPTLIVRRFFQIDGIRKGMLMAFNLFISILPLTILLFAFVSRLRNRISLSQVFIEQFHLSGETANVVRTAFPTNGNIRRIASAIAIVSFALSGFDVASVFQRTFSDAWNVRRMRRWHGPMRGAVWFVMVFATFALSQLLQRGPAKYGLAAYLATVPIVLAMYYAFWLVTPRLMLDKRLENRDLRSGAVIGTLLSTALWILSLAILPGWFSWYGRGFGGVGIALALLSWTYVVSIVWVVTVVIAAVLWERNAPLDDVVDLSTAEQLRI